MENGSDASLELAKELHNVFVVEELRAGLLYKRANGFTWHKRYFTVVPFELRWYPSGDKSGEPKRIPLNENTLITFKDNKIQVTNGQRTIKLKGKDARVCVCLLSKFEIFRMHFKTRLGKQLPLSRKKQKEKGLRKKWQ